MKLFVIKLQVAAFFLIFCASHETKAQERAYTDAKPMVSLELDSLIILCETDDAIWPDSLDRFNTYSLHGIALLRILLIQGYTFPARLWIGASGVSSYIRFKDGSGNEISSEIWNPSIDIKSTEHSLVVQLYGLSSLECMADEEVNTYLTSIHAFYAPIRSYVKKTIKENSKYTNIFLKAGELSKSEKFGIRFERSKKCPCNSK